MALKIKSKAAPAPSATVTKDIEHNKQVTASTIDTVDVEVPEKAMGLAKGEVAVTKDDWCNVGFEASYTHNLGNFTSARVAVNISIPCPPGEINGVFDFAKEWVNEKLGVCVEELVSSAE